MRPLLPTALLLSLLSNAAGAEQTSAATAAGVAD